MDSQTLNNKKIVIIGTNPTEAAEIQKSLLPAGCKLSFPETTNQKWKETRESTFDALVIKPSTTTNIDEGTEYLLVAAINKQCPIILLVEKETINPAQVVSSWKATDYAQMPLYSGELPFRLSIHLKHRESLEQTEKEAARSQMASLYKITNNIPLPFAITNCEGEIQYINPKFTELFEFELREIPTVEIWFKKTYPSAIVRKIAYAQWKKIQSSQCIQNNHKSEYTLFSKGGSKHIVEIYVEKFDTFCFIIFHDISQQKHDLLEIKKLSEAIYQNPASIVITDHKGNIIFVNPKFTEITGYTSEEVMGLNPSIQRSGMVNPEVYSELWHTILSGKTWQGEFLNLKKNGDFYWEKAIISPILNDEGQIVNFIAIKEDISETRKAIEELVKSEQALKEANTTKDKFFSIIAHDLRNPIGSIRNMTAVLMKMDKHNPDYQAFVNQIYNSSSNTADLLEDLLNWARSQTGNLISKPISFDVGKEISSATEPLDELVRTKKISLTINHQATKQGYADTKLFNTIVRNLVSNAIKFTRENGEISIDTANKKDCIQIRVFDNGVGIESERISDLFYVEKNYSTPGTAFETGTGMGLPLCKEFVVKMGGIIWIESQLGKGTQVSFTIPSNE